MKKNRYYEKAAKAADHILWDPQVSSGSRLLSVPAAVARLFFKIGQEIRKGQITVRAASLVYTTILSLVPFLALAFSVLKAMGVHNKLKPLLIEVLQPLGSKGTDIAAAIITFVDKINVGVLGAVGLALLIYSVVSSIQQVENAFNYTWQVTKDRTILRKLRDYLSVVLIGPVLIVSALGITGTIMSASIVVKLQSIEPLGSIIVAAGRLLPYLLVILAFTFMYYMLPNTKVRFGSAFVGGVCAGVLWQTGGWAFAVFVVASSKYPAIYSGFAVVLLFMVWIYYNWIILLVGSKISFYHQYSDLLAMKDERMLAGYRLLERTALAIMFLIGESFYHDKPRWTVGRLVSTLRLPIKYIQDILDSLSGEGGLLYKSEEELSYMPGRDMDSIMVKDILDRIRTESDDKIAGMKRISAWSQIDSILNNMDRAAFASIEDISLKHIVLQGEATQK